MAIDSTIGGTASVRPGLSRVIIAATIGNVLEGFDFVVYGPTASSADFFGL